jgi:hypothetical protein
LVTGSAKISALGAAMRSPLSARMMVERRLICSTVPSTSRTLIRSPTT